jgi:hypothetical protein
MIGTEPASTLHPRGNDPGGPTRPSGAHVVRTQTIQLTDSAGKDRPVHFCDAWRHVDPPKDLRHARSSLPREKPNPVCIFSYGHVYRCDFITFTPPRVEQNSIRSVRSDFQPERYTGRLFWRSFNRDDTGPTFWGSWADLHFHKNTKGNKKKK